MSGLPVRVFAYPRLALLGGKTRGILKCSLLGRLWWHWGFRNVRNLMLAVKTGYSLAASRLGANMSDSIHLTRGQPRAKDDMRMYHFEPQFNSLKAFLKC